MTRRRLALSDVLLSLGALSILLLMLMALDTNVREQISMRLAAPSASAHSAQVTAGEMAALVAGAVRDQSIAHAPLTMFVVAATVLLLFMLRT